MAVNVQVWLRDIQENLYPDNSFVVKSIDDSTFVNNNKVHIPNAGAPSKVEINRATKPAQEVGQRTDSDLEYGIDELTTNPIYIPHIDTVELSYDKRTSIIQNDRNELSRVAHINVLERWAKGAGKIIKTTGKDVVPHTHSSATGKRKSISRADVLSIMTEFDRQEIPAEGRYLLLDADMYAQLLADLAESDKYAFFQSADAQKGIVGNLYGINIMKRSSVLRIKADGETLLYHGEEPEATECGAGLAWHSSCVSRAIGEMKMFDSTNNPQYYGDIYSFLVRTGGSHRRTDKKGVIILAEATAN